MYFFYPETAGRTLEDVDRFFDTNKNILIFTDKDAKSNKRPAAYEENEQEEMRRNSSVSPQMARRRTSLWQDQRGGMRRSVEGDYEKSEAEYRQASQV